MLRNRFDDMWINIVFSNHAERDEVQDGSIERRWSLVNDFIDYINNHRETYFTPSHIYALMTWFQYGMDEREFEWRWHPPFCRS